jgi:hypothetical protein
MVSLGNVVSKGRVQKPPLQEVLNAPIGRLYWVKHLLRWVKMNSE